jgi:hypothetical protein
MLHDEPKVSDDVTVSGTELRRFLSDCQMTQQHLADELEIARDNASRWINGKWSPARGFHIAVRCLMEHKRKSPITIPKQKPGRPLLESGFFDVSKARCDYSDCKRGNRQMWGDHKGIYRHPLLGKILPVFCNGTHANRHPRVTRALDTKGQLSKLSDFPHRKKLTPFEKERVTQTRKSMGDQLSAEARAEALVKALQHCTALDAQPGCGGVMIYNGHPAHTSITRRKLHVMYCRNPDCELRWERRFFDDNGDEQRGTKWGEHCLDRRQRQLPPNLKRGCPVCDAELRYPKEISAIGGDQYHPPLLRVRCLNPDKKDHGPRIREQLDLPAGTRSGLTFYYDQKHSKFIQIHLKALKKGHPILNCRAHGHGRMRVTTIRKWDSRVPKNVREKLGSILPIHLARCRFGDSGFWISTDKKTRIPYTLRRTEPMLVNTAEAGER